MHNLESMAVHLLWLTPGERNSPYPVGKKDILVAVGKGIHLGSLRNCEREEIAPLYLFSSQTSISLVNLAMWKWSPFVHGVNPTRRDLLHHREIWETSSGKNRVSEEDSPSSGGRRLHPFVLTIYQLVLNFYTAEMQRLPSHKDMVIMLQALYYHLSYSDYDYIFFPVGIIYYSN